MDKISVRDRQIDVARAMLNLNSKEWQPDWKFLIYDTIGQNILAPLFSVEDLKNHNVTSHLLIHSQRDPVPDVSAVYFVMPNDENVERICEDISNNTYDYYYLNFISTLPRSKMELIVEAALLANATSNIRKIYDQYLNFIALEDDLFVLRESQKHMISFHAINRSEASEREISTTIDYVVDCLFSVFETLNTIPIIRSPRGGSAELVADKLAKRMSEALRDSRSSLFDSKESRSGSSIGLTFQRPLLCIVDRTMDMSTPLHHTWTYQALIHDILNTELNKVRVTETSKDKLKPTTQVFDLNPSDKFWREQRGTPFPQVAEAVQRELDEYKNREDEIKNPIGIKADGTETENDLLLETKKISEAISSVKELREHKRVIAMHTTIAHSVLDEIKSRKLDNFFEIEEKIMNRNLIDRVTLDEMLANPDYGQPSDKYRLFLISYICDNPNLSEEETEKYVNVLEGLGCKRTAFEYVKRWKTFSKVNVASLQSSLQSSGGVLKTASMFSKLMSQGSQFVMEGVKNLVLKEHLLPLTMIIDALMDSSKPNSEASSYTYLDPKSPPRSTLTRKKTFQNAIVFVVGGGNYIEYQNLIDYQKSRSKGLANEQRSIIYGSTELTNAGEFLRQLCMLGQGMNQ